MGSGSGEELRGRREHRLRLVAMRRMPAGCEFEPADMARAELDAVDLCHRAILVLDALDREHRAGDVGQ